MNDDRVFSEHETHAHPDVLPPGRSLSLATQVSALLIFAGILVAILFVVPAVVGLAASPDDASTSSTDAFQPTEQQWAGLKVRRVSVQTYAPLVQTDGRIALDDDYSTPVFSPYSGRVTRVLARAGDDVVAGTPLFAVLSPELALAENDMISALGNLRTAASALSRPWRGAQGL
jgi:cobalt-zinc-cadmium efflux system membrane fusion protein